MKKTWTATWAGETVTLEEVTAGEAVLLQILTGDHSWDALDPMRSPVHLVSTFVVVASRNVPLEAAQVAVHSTPLRELLNALEAADGDGN